MRETIVCFAVLESYGRIMSSSVSVIEVEHGVGPRDLILLAASPDITMGLGGKLSHSCPRLSSYAFITKMATVRRLLVTSRRISHIIRA
jgi:hypothetical protein